MPDPNSFVHHLPVGKEYVMATGHVRAQPDNDTARASGHPLADDNYVIYHNLHLQARRRLPYEMIVVGP
jgi:hypothetical protein